MWNNWFHLRQIRLPTMSAFYVVWSIIISIALVVWVSMNRRPNSTREQRPMTQNRNIARSGIEIHVIDRVLVCRKSWDQTTKRIPSWKCFFRPRNTWYCSLRFVRRWNRPYWLGFRFLEKAGSNYIEIDIGRVLFCVFVDLNEVEERRFRIKRNQEWLIYFESQARKPTVATRYTHQNLLCFLCFTVFCDFLRKKANCCNTIYSLESSMFTLFYSLLSLFATTSLTLSKITNFGRRLNPTLFLSGIKAGNLERTGWAHRAPRLANQKTGFASYCERYLRCNNVHYNASQNVLATCYELEVFPMLIFVSRHLWPWYQNSAIIRSNSSLS